MNDDHTGEVFEGELPDTGRPNPKSLSVKRDTAFPISTRGEPTKHQLRIIDTAAEIRARSAEASDLIWGARELVQATLPHSNPSDEEPEWHRHNGNLTLSVRPGYMTDPDTGKRVCVGYPWGAVPRLLIFWITTQAVQTGERRLELGNTLNEFLRQVGMNPTTGGGVRGDANRLKNQLQRLLRASISFEYNAPGHQQWQDMAVAPKGELWWDPKAPDQGILFDSWLELGETFFDAITAHPVPVDIRALKALKKSPLALDLYAWLVYRSFTQRNKRQASFVPWAYLMKQMGANYAEVANFKKACKPHLRKIAALCGTVPFEDVSGGLSILPGRQMISSKSG